MTNQQAADKASRSGTQAIERAVTLLRVIASRGRRGMRIAEVSSTAGLAHATCFRMLQCLQKEGMVEKDGHTHKYFLGQLVHELGLLARPRYRLSDLCDRELKQLAQQTLDTVYLNERSGLDAVCTARQIGSYPITVLPLDVGIRRPLGVGIGGLALLGAMDPAESEALVRLNGPRYSGFGGLTTELVLQAVYETRKRGYSFMDGVVTPGVADLGVAFPPQQPVAAICVAAISGRMTESRHAELVKRIRVQIASITSVLATLGDIAPT